MEAIVSEKIIKPQNCVLCFGIPTSRNDFFIDIRDEKKEFAKLFKGGWIQYYSQISIHIEKLENIYKELGVKIVHKLTIENFGQILQSKKFDVVILFSHWSKDAIEFNDGFFLYKLNCE